MRLVLSALCLVPLLCAEEYSLGPDSQRQPNVPRGTVISGTFANSKIYPGTTRSYWVYVPEQYRPSTAAALMVFQDGAGWIKEDGASRAPVVLDNLIARGEMPVTIGVFIDPGVLPAREESHMARYNRSFEYDSMSDRYSRFLLEELLPEVEKQYNISRDPNHRAIAGSSSGAICAFNVAWQRPDAFRRVLSFIGSYTNLRGADAFPALIRKSETKPIRVFLQDGRKDSDIYAGSWFRANESLASALEFAGYDFQFIIGDEAHNMKHGGAILPESLRWLWRGYPAPVARGASKSERHLAAQLADPSAGWEVISSGHKFTEGPAVDREGNLFFTDVSANQIWKITPDGKRSVFKENSGGAIGLAFGTDGRLYSCQNGRKRIVAYAADGSETVVAEGMNSNDIAISSKGDIYVTDHAGKKLWLIRPGGEKRVVHEGMTFPNGVRLSADHSLLIVNDSAARSVWSFQIQPDGSLAHGQPFYRLELPEEQSNAWADGMAVDTEGYLYIATRYGVMVCDQPGRVVAILDKPQEGPLAYVTFGGPDMRTLYAAAGDKIFRRPMRRTGVAPFTTVKPPQPRL